jgi:hypothetical protein
VRKGRIVPPVPAPNNNVQPGTIVRRPRYKMSVRPEVIVRLVYQRTYRASPVIIVRRNRSPNKIVRLEVIARRPLRRFNVRPEAIARCE